MSLLLFPFPVFQFVRQRLWQSCLLPVLINLHHFLEILFLVVLVVHNVGVGVDVLVRVGVSRAGPIFFFRPKYFDLRGLSKNMIYIKFILILNFCNFTIFNLNFQILYLLLTCLKATVKYNNFWPNIKADTILWQKSVTLQNSVTFITPWHFHQHSQI